MLFWKVLREILHAYFLAMLIDAFRKAFAYELEELMPEEERNVNYFTEIIKKVDKFSKEKLPEFE